MDHAVTVREKAFALLGTWSRPPDLPAKVALGLAVVLAMAALVSNGGWLHGLDRRASAEARASERRRFLALVAFAAALSSVVYVSVYLHGGPRIIDATTYFLQGRALSHGDLAWTPPPGPSASWSGRFLIHRVAPDGDVLGGIFPPGYPLLLAFGFGIGAPMIVGPLLAAALVVATYRLARLLAAATFPERAEPIARAAALLSLFCAALRYHTADTMSHGAAALGVILALTSALRVRGGTSSAGGGALLAGLSLGYVAATRPVSALPIGAVVLWLVTPPAPRRAAWVLAGTLPGVLLLLLSQRAVTGSWLESTQRMYYAISDGPPGCFRWGFGKGTGCLFEHRDFVESRLANGYGPLEAAGTTLRRLHAHLLDVANLEPLALLVLLPFFRRRQLAAALPLAALVVLQILAYAPFYFDGDYPGGGARFFADVLPIEHVLLVLGVAALTPRGATDSFARRAVALLALALAGFAVHGAYEHGKLRDRDGGRPMYEPDVLARAAVTKGLVLVDTDHGFAIGHDPAKNPDTGILVARRRRDAHDWLLWQALGKPPTWLYDTTPDQPTATLTPFKPIDPGATFRFEAEAEWPALAQENGFAVPRWVNACASQQRALVLTPEPGRVARATITVPVPSEGEWIVEPLALWKLDDAAPRSQAETRGSVTLGGVRWDLPRSPNLGCIPLGGQAVTLKPPAATLVVETSGAPLGLDAIDLRKVPR